MFNILDLVAYNSKWFSKKQAVNLPIWREYKWFFIWQQFFLNVVGEKLRITFKFLINIIVEMLLGE